MKKEILFRLKFEGAKKRYRKHASPWIETIPL